MTAVFADSFYFFAILNPRDAAHNAAVAFATSETRRLITTTSVLIEVGDGLASTRHRPVLSKLLDELEADPLNHVVHPSIALFKEAATLYERMQDKEWSLTDCISFVVMREYGIREAWTGDKHFRQAGFETLAP
jgi:hypothetical protein